MLVYPNPNSGVFMLELSGDLNLIESINLFDSFGRLVASKAYESDLQIRFDLSGLADGMYFLQVGSTKIKAMHKILISR